MTRTGCPVHLAAVVTTASGCTPLVLDAEALLPPVVESASTSATRFHREAIELLEDLGRAMLRPVELEHRLLRLSRVAAAYVPAFAGKLPDEDRSGAASLGTAGLREAEVAERIRYDRFFGIRRVTRLDAQTLARGLFGVLAAASADIGRAQLGQHEVRAVLHGMVEATRWVDSVNETKLIDEEDGLITPITPLRRFVLGHHLFALMATFARHHIDLVTDNPRSASAPRDLLLACRYMRASTAAMWYTVSFPPDAYRDLVRPTMDAASSEEHGFSGGDNFDFRRLREAWEHLHPSLLSSWDGLGESTREMARLLYETIVLDNEHHTAIAAEMVGLLPSLDADRQARRFHVHSMSAVSSLRLNTDDRRALRNRLPG